MTDWAANGQLMRRSVVSRLQVAVSMASTADIQRAAEFLEFAYEQKTGKRSQRALSRAAQRERARRSRAA